MSFSFFLSTFCVSRHSRLEVFCCCCVWRRPHAVTQLAACTTAVTTVLKRERPKVTELFLRLRPAAAGLFGSFNVRPGWSSPEVPSLARGANQQKPTVVAELNGSKNRAFASEVD